MKEEQIELLRQLSNHLKRVKQGVKNEIVMRDIKKLDLDVVTFLLDNIKVNKPRTKRITHEK